MRKNIVKLLAIFLTVVLVISVAPVSTFAATDTQSTKIACTHSICYGTEGGRYESCGSAEYHDHYVLRLSTCASCGMTFEKIMSVSEEAHVVESWDLVSYSDNYFFYEGECKYCGEKLALTLSRS